MDSRSVESEDLESCKTGNAQIAVSFSPSNRFYRSFLSIAVLALAAALATTTYSVAAAKIISAIPMSTSETLWAAVSAALAGTLIQPVCPTLCDILGRLGATVVAGGALAIGSVVGSFAPTATTLILARCLQGLGSGAATAITEILVTEMVPLHLRGYWFSLLSVAWAVGTITGPVIGGAIAGISTSSWVGLILIMKISYD